jgi:hypothetical protein
MAMTSLQVARLVAALVQHSDRPGLGVMASDLGLTLEEGDLRQGVLKLVSELNAELPPRDGALLTLVRQRGNRALRDVVDEIEAVDYFAPTHPGGAQDPHEATVLGRAAFVNRLDLRTRIRDFTNPTDYTTRMLVVRGDEPCGKSYTFHFLHHLARATIGATALRLRLRNVTWTPRSLFEEVYKLLRWDPSRVPAQLDDPQLARIDSLLNTFKGDVAAMEGQRYWLVIDDVNEPNVTPPVREAALAIAHAAEEVKSTHLWVALLGYNAEITDEDLRWVAQEDARFPDEAEVAEHFCALAGSGPTPLTRDEADVMARAVFSEFPELDKAAMEKLTVRVEKMGAKLKLGEDPWASATPGH